MTFYAIFKFFSRTPTCPGPYPRLEITALVDQNSGNGSEYFRTHELSFLRGVSKKFCEWYQKTNKTEDTNELTLLTFKIIAILHNTLLATFVKLLETLSKGIFKESIAEPLSHVLGLPPRLQNVRLS
jgi:hypothetical protein